VASDLFPIRGALDVDARRLAYPRFAALRSRSSRVEAGEASARRGCEFQTIESKLEKISTLRLTGRGAAIKYRPVSGDFSRAIASGGLRCSGDTWR